MVPLPKTILLPFVARPWKKHCDALQWERVVDEVYYCVIVQWIDEKGLVG
jgi:hypothetical protein